MIVHQSECEAPLHPDIADYVEKIEGMNLPPLLSAVRVAALLDLDRRRVYELVSVGELAAVRTGVRGVRVFRDGLLDWLRRGGSGAGRA